MIEAFVICFAGEYLSLKGKLIANAIYESLWYDMPSNKNKIIVFIIMRSQKRLTITAGKMMDMSLETFTRIMKASASVIYQLLAAMDNDWHECVDIDQHLYMMTIKANTSHFYANVMTSIYIIVGVFYLLSGYVVRFVYEIEDYNNTLREFPIKVLHVSGQIDILCQEFKTISAKVLPDKTSTSTLGVLIERHNRVFWFSDNIETLFSFIALMQVIWNTLVICSLGFIIIISFYIETGVTTILKSIFAYLAVILEVFILCFAGEYLNLKSKSIADAAYESFWYDLPLNQRKILMFIIMRSQKQLMITAGRITSLSLTTFTSIIKASASYVSVLHAMY
ncbi:PREDICTED: odorant receptor 22c-like [Acromyrmex echinatior]|uniref:odorant receptor 22c-like n=2 Tax=Attini TaxID=143999 RepID=UPI000580D8C0|nr:PREDICTED: odorant receptor 22c-like [Acromyrmex echinatior]